MKESSWLLMTTKLTRTALPLLSAEGYEVVCAANGQEALARVDSGSIDLACWSGDARPTGFEICQGMKSKPETRLIPVILLTSLNSDADRIHGILCALMTSSTSPK